MSKEVVNKMERYIICRYTEDKWVSTSYSYTDFRQAKTQCTKCNRYGWYKGEYYIVKFKSEKVIYNE